MSRGLKIVLAVVLTLVVLFLSRYFGPNHKYTVEMSVGNATFSHKAPRSQIGEGPAELMLKVSGQVPGDLYPELVGQVKGAGEWERFTPARVDLDAEYRVYVFQVPAKPWTTRYLYRFEVLHNGKTATLAHQNGDPMMVKFKGEVPAWIVACHVLGMFGGFLLLILCVFYALELARGKNENRTAGRLAWWSWIVLFIGAVPFGIPMNYYAFNVYWEAFPFGGDVTDNKSQIALIIWLLAALALSFRRGRKTGLITVLAGLVVLAIFLIPHSAQLS
jgi:hypothetical protein